MPPPSRLAFESYMNASRARYTFWAEGSSVERPRVAIDVGAVFSDPVFLGADRLMVSLAPGFGIRHSFLDDRLRLRYALGFRHQVTLGLGRSGAESRVDPLSFSFAQGIGFDARLSIDLRMYETLRRETRVGLEAAVTVNVPVSEVQLTPSGPASEPVSGRISTQVAVMLNFSSPF